MLACASTSAVSGQRIGTAKAVSLPSRARVFSCGGVGPARAHGVRGGSRGSRRGRGVGTVMIPSAVSIYDTVRGDDERSSSSSAPEPPGPPTVADYSTPQRPVAAAPIVAPAVISSKAYMLSNAEDLAAGVSCDEEDDEAECLAKKEQDGILTWTLKYVDKNLDAIEKEKPRQAEVAWKVASEAEKVARSPEMQRATKLTADVGMEVVKAAAPIVGKVAGGIGKFAAKSAFKAAISGVMPKKKKDGDDKGKKVKK